MDEQTYIDEKKFSDYFKLSQELLAQRFYSKILDATWTRYSSYYEGYEKAERLMKMHAINRKALVQDSYLRSF